MVHTEFFENQGLFKDFSRTKIIFSRTPFLHEVKCVGGGGFAYCNTLLH